MKTSTPEVVGRPEAEKIRIDAFYRFEQVKDIPTPAFWDMKDGDYVVLRDTYQDKVVAAGRDAEKPTGDLADPGVVEERYEPFRYLNPTGEAVDVLWVHLPKTDSIWVCRILDTLMKRYTQQIKELKRTLAATQNDLQWRDELLRWHRVPWYIKLFTGLWKEPKRLV